MSKQWNRQIPHTLEECTKTGTAVSALYITATAIEKWGKILIYCLIIGGVFSMIADAVSVMDIDEDALIPTLIWSISSWILYVFIGIIVYCVLPVLLRVVASIAENTMITANVALYEAGKKEIPAEKVSSEQKQTPPAADQPIPKANSVVSEDGSWICSNCGQRNLSTRTSCWRCDCEN